MYRAHVCVERTNTHIKYMNTSHWGVIRKTKCLKKFCGEVAMERRLRNAAVAKGLCHLTKSMTSLLACPLIVCTHCLWVEPSRKPELKGVCWYRLAGQPPGAQSRVRKVEGAFGGVHGEANGTTKSCWDKEPKTYFGSWRSGHLVSRPAFPSYLFHLTLPVSQILSKLLTQDLCPWTCCSSDTVHVFFLPSSPSTLSLKATFSGSPAWPPGRNPSSPL